MIRVEHIKADAGWRTAYLCDDGSIYYQDVLAWRVESEEIRGEWCSFVFPVSCQSILEPYALVSPRGAWIFPEDKIRGEWCSFVFPVSCQSILALVSPRGAWIFPEDNEFDDEVKAIEYLFERKAKERQMKAGK